MNRLELSGCSETRLGFVSKTSVFLATLIALVSTMPWFLWGSGYVVIGFLGLFLVLRTLRFRRHTVAANVYPIFFCVVMWAYLFVVHAEFPQDAITSILTRLLPLIAVILFSTAEKELFIRYTTNLFSIITLTSLVFFTVWFCGIALPHTTLEMQGNSWYGSFTNYYVFIIVADLGVFTRFQSVFTEPGHLGMIMSLLLYINRYNLRKWQCWVMLIALLWSLSLAAYVLLFIGVSAYVLARSRHVLITGLKLLVGILFSVVLGVGIYFTNEDSVLSTLILSRLQLDEERGIAGNNRHEESFKRYYEKFQEKSEYYTGLGLSGYGRLFKDSANSSYKVFIIQYGLIGLLLLALFGFSFVCSYPSRLVLGLFVLYCASFWQRPYALWEVESFSYICAAGTFFYPKKHGTDDSVCGASPKFTSKK